MQQNNANPSIHIPLSQGYEAVVDQEDGDLVNFGWCVSLVGNGNAYALRSVKKGLHWSTQTMHRLILERKLGTSLPAGHECDHKDGNGLNNRRSNLRLANHTENMRNRKTQNNNHSGVTGVNWHQLSQKWMARIQVEGKCIYLGIFEAKEGAIAARKQAEIEYFGAFRASAREDGVS